MFLSHATMARRERNLKRNIIYWWCEKYCNSSLSPLPKISSAHVFLPVSLDQQNKNFDFTKDLVFQDPFYISTALSPSFPHIYVYYSDSLFIRLSPILCIQKEKEKYNKYWKTFTTRIKRYRWRGRPEKWLIMLPSRWLFLPASFSIFYFTSEY